MSYDHQPNDDAMIERLIAAGISQALIDQTRATHGNWRDLLRSVEVADLAPGASDLDQLYKKFLP